MNYKKFCNYLTAIINAENARNNQHDEEAMATFGQSRIWAMNRLKDIFHDEDGNLERWLNGERCVFRPSQKAEFMEIRIGNDVEALYYFLCFCDKLNTHQRISEDFRDYLSLLITRSCSEYWEEC